VFLHHVKIVQQPLAGGADVYAAVGSGGQLGVDRVQDFPGFVQANEQRCLSAPLPGILQPLSSRDGASPLVEMLDAEQLALDRSGTEMVPVGRWGGVLGTAAAGQLDGRDGPDLAG
jgi:hypothetical protein